MLHSLQNWAAERRGLTVVLVLYIVLALAYNIADPLFEAPDENLHYQFVQYMQSEWNLPILHPDDPKSEKHQPPAYYIVGAAITTGVSSDDLEEHIQPNPFWGYNIGEVGRDNKNQFLHGPDQRFPYRKTALGAHLLRLLSTLGGVAAVIFTYRFVLLLLPRRSDIALGSAALVAFTPNFLLTTAAVSNDAWIIALPVGIMIYVFTLLDQPDPPTFLQWALLSVMLSFLALVKLSGFPMMPVSAVLAGLVAWKHRSFKIFIIAGVILLGGVLLLLGWWFARNLRLYGDLTALSHMWQVWGVRPPLTLAQYRIEAWNFRTTYWANFGYGNVPVPNLIYGILDVLTVLGVLGLLLRLWDRLHKPTETDRPQLAVEKIILLVVWMLITWVALIWYLQKTIQVTGRQIYPILPAQSFFLIWGWTRLVPRRWHSALITASGAAMLAFAVGSLFGVLIPAYRPAPRLPADQIDTAIPNRLDWQLGDVATLLGYSVSHSSVDPGGEVEVTLYWQAIDPPADQNYTVFIHLFGEDNELVGARDTYPGLGNDPTIYWEPGEIIVDTIPVPVAPDAAGPILLDIEAGLYNLDTGERLPVTGPDGGPIGYPVIGTVRLTGIGQDFGEPANRLDAVFEGEIIIEGYTLEQDSGTLTLTLYWAIGRHLPGADHTVFVQLVDEADQIVAQGDGPPRGGRYPVSAWGGGERFDDVHIITLPDDLPPGEYDLLVGLYNPVDGTRLLFEDGSDHIRLDNVLIVDTPQ